MSRSTMFALALCGLATICTLPAAEAQALSTPYESTAAAESRSGWDALGGLYALLAQHDALGGHALARKSVRSPSRRLRFGRRSDPDMPPQTPADELEELLNLRDVRTPVRLRFGRRSEEHAVPHVFPQEMNELEMSPRDLRTPRLRFGRRSDDSQKMDEADEIMSLRDIRTPLRLRFGRRSEESTAPHAQKIDDADDVMAVRDARTPLRLRFGRSEERAVPHTFPQEEQDRAVRAPSMRLRFGRRSDNNMFLMPYESTLPKEVKANVSVEDDRQQE